MTTGIVLPGVTGRMGKLIAQQVLSTDETALLVASARPGSDAVGNDVGLVCGVDPCGQVVEDDLERGLAAVSAAQLQGAVLIDFTSPAALETHVRVAVRKGMGLLVGTTGYDAAVAAALDDASNEIPVLVASNCAVGPNLLLSLTRLTAAARPAADVEIVELHHRHKRDSPSGTALSLGQAAASARETALEDVLTTCRSGDRVRRQQEMGIFGVRGGDVTGEHTVYFFLDGERIELTHRATDRRIFASGAVRAARWLGGRPPGRYSMADVLGLPG
ncbi:MAG: 4-hydroxy-tetrahydrodipicolinate reductase [Myxococcota bacterium]